MQLKEDMKSIEIHLYDFVIIKLLPSYVLCYSSTHEWMEGWMDGWREKGIDEEDEDNQKAMFPLKSLKCLCYSDASKFSEYGQRLAR